MFYYIWCNKCRNHTKHEVKEDKIICLICKIEFEGYRPQKRVFIPKFLSDSYEGRKKSEGTTEAN